MTLPSPFCNEDWTYFKAGEDWNCKCSEGKQQSPVNIKTGCAKNNEIDEGAQFHFNSLEIKDLVIVWEDNMMKIKCAHSDEKDCKTVIFATMTDSELT